MIEALTNNEAKSRYELHIDGGTAVAMYERRGSGIALTHTIVPEPLQGRGIASALIKAALADIRRSGLKILPECPFVAAYIERHPEDRDLVAD